VRSLGQGTDIGDARTVTAIPHFVTFYEVELGAIACGFDRELPW
jgi:hypothetical protein